LKGKAYAYRELMVDEAFSQQSKYLPADQRPVPEIAPI